MATMTRPHPLDSLSPGGDPAGWRAPTHVDPDTRRGATAAGDRRPRRREVLAWAFTFAGMLTIGFGWYGISGEANTWRQLPYLLSGGVGGASLVALGVALLVSSEHAHDRDALDVLLDRLDAIEHELVELGGPLVARTARRRVSPAESATADARTRGGARGRNGATARRNVRGD